MSMATRTDTQSPVPQAADSHDLIRVHGARVNNLKDLSVQLPKRRLTVFTGVSGSGKSSLVFGTIAAESQRLINETYSAFVQGFMPTLARPDVDVLDGLTTAIIVDQERMGANVRSTVGTATGRQRDAAHPVQPARQAARGGPPQAFLVQRRLDQRGGRGRRASAAGRPSRSGAASASPAACARAARAGARSPTAAITDPALYDDCKSLTEGALSIPGYKAGGWNYRLYSASGFFDPDKPIRTYTKKGCTTSSIASRPG